MTAPSLRKYRMRAEGLHRDLNLLILAVTFGMAYMTVYNGPSFNAFVRSLGGGDFIFAAMMAMPVFTGLLQLVASVALRRAGRRRKLFITAGLIQRLILIPISLVPLLLPERYQSVRLLLVLVLIATNAGAQAFMTIIFSSWIGALVPGEIRGRYLSRRAVISTVTSLVVAPLSGLFLDAVPGPKGYAILFSFVAVLGAMDIVCFFWVSDPPMTQPQASMPLHRQLTSPLRDANYRRFIVFATVFQFSLNLSGSFFTPFMLEHLHMSMLAITLLTQTVMSLFTILFVSRVGRLMDRFGMKTVMSVAATGIAFLPLFWHWSTPGNYFVIIFLVQMLSGILWPALELGLMNLSIWLAPEENRPSYLASYAFVVALFGILPGQLIGGGLMEAAGAWLRNHPMIWPTGRPVAPFDFLLVLSCAGRLLAATLLLPRVHDKDTDGTAKDVIRGFFLNPSRWVPHKPEAMDE